MSLRTATWPAGVPCWIELSTPDVHAASAFYSAVLGWVVEPTDEQAGGSTIATMRGAAAAGLGTSAGAPPQLGVPAAWTLYFAADDVDAIAARIPQLGGTLLLPPDDVRSGGSAPLGRSCVAADPTGAAFGVWQAGTHIGAGVVNEPGALVWDDLRSTDPGAAHAFYAALFGFRLDPLPEAGPDYATYALPGDAAAGLPVPLGGMGGMFGAPAGSPSHWLVYVAVSDAAATVAAAKAAGGTVLSEEFGTPYGTMATITDPAGAVFVVLEPPEGAPQPDRSG